MKIIAQRLCKCVLLCRDILKFWLPVTAVLEEGGWAPSAENVWISCMKMVHFSAFCTLLPCQIFFTPVVRRPLCPAPGDICLSPLRYATGLFGKLLSLYSSNWWLLHRLGWNLAWPPRQISNPSVQGWGRWAQKMIKFSGFFFQNCGV